MYGYMAAMLPGKSVPDIARHNDWYVCCIQTSMPMFCRLQKCCNLTPIALMLCRVCCKVLVACKLFYTSAGIFAAALSCKCKFGSLLACTVYTLLGCSQKPLLLSEAPAAVLMLTAPPVVPGSGKNECWTDVAKTCCVHGRRHTRYRHASCTLCWAAYLLGIDIHSYHLIYFMSRLRVANTRMQFAEADTLSHVEHSDITSDSWSPMTSAVMLLWLQQSWFVKAPSYRLSPMLQAFLSDASRTLQQSVQQQATSAESAAERWDQKHCYKGCWHAPLCIEQLVP